jgi:hypothetical protein
MRIVKDALFAKLSGDTGTGSLEALLGGAGRISQGMIPDAANLPWLTFREITAVVDSELPAWSELYQISAWSRSLDKNDAIKERVRALLHKQPLDTVTGATWFCLFDFERELTEDSGLYQKLLQFRIGTFA